tara:strand:- start:348 stop:1115 length:768 start_codon:yes stop_codon:yes gene_type:complete
LLIIPAIDLRQGKVVNLRQGKVSEETAYSDNPINIADRWIGEGATRLHIVDLDGAFKGSPINGQIVKKIKNKYPEIEIQLGGGIRTKQDIESYLEAGVDFLILGTKAVTAPDFLNQICCEFPGKIILGLDALDGKVATHGWEEITQIETYEFAGEAAKSGVVAIIFTDIASDGMMQGLNLKATIDLAEKVSVPIIASGGVRDLEDIEALGMANQGLDSAISGVILGRSLYEKTLTVSQAIKKTAEIKKTGLQERP